MGDTFRLAMQLTMIDLMSGVASRAKAHIKELGEEGKRVAKDFEQMELHATRGLKAIAIANYTINKVKPGVAAAAELQGSTLDVKMNLKESGQNAADLARQLAQVRATATDIQKQMPFGATEVTGIENVLLKAGLQLKDVTAKGGAAWAASALATISQEAPGAMGEGLVKIATPFDLRGGQYAELAEFIAKVDQASVTSVPALVEGMKFVAGNAARLKVDWHEILHAMGVMAQSGLDGSIAGTSLNDFLDRLNGHSRETRRVLHEVNRELGRKGMASLEFWDGNGQLKKFPELVAILRKSMAPFNDKQQSFILNKVFGEQGGRAAFALMKEGAGSWEEVGKGIGRAASMQEKLNIRLEGFSANVTALEGTAKTTLANLFDPALASLTKLTQGTNDLTDAVGRLAGNHPALAGTFDALLGIGVVGAGGYGAYKLAKGGYYGAKVLKGLRGLPMVSTGIGIAEGKAVQAATGVNPVFVTNWPDGFGSAAAVANAGGIAAGAGSRAALAGSLAAAGLVTAVATAPIVSKIISDATRANGWGSSTVSRNSREYEVMGIGRAKNDIRLEVQIDGSGRVTSRTSDMSTRITTVPRGSFFTSDGMMKGHN